MPTCAGYKGPGLGFGLKPWLVWFGSLDQIICGIIGNESEDALQVGVQVAFQAAKALASSDISLKQAGYPIFHVYRLQEREGLQSRRLLACP
eukprot:1156248-Pelagomonas_calceolata.AAC.1